MPLFLCIPSILSPHVSVKYNRNPFFLNPSHICCWDVKYVSATAIPNSHLICLSLGTKKSVSKSWTHAPGHQDTLYGTLKIASKYFLWNLRLLKCSQVRVHKWSKTRKCTSSDQKNLDSGVISYWKGNYIYDTSYCCRWFLKVWRWNLSRHPSWRVKTPKLLFDLK